MEIVRPGQFVAFLKDLDSGASCAPDGRPYDDQGEAACVLFDSMADARAFGEAAVAQTPALRVDIFDAQGRAHPPLLTVVHPTRAPQAETHPRVLRRRSIIAWLLIAAGIPLVVFAYVEHKDREIILPAFVGINMIIAAARLFWFNLALRETERVREARLNQADRATTQTTRLRDG